MKNMDYEKKYNEALDWMRELYPGLHGATKEDAEHYFPELKESNESKDERIRKAIVELVKRTPSSMFDADTVGKWIGASHDEILAYLEKQKEQKPSINIDQLKSIMLQYLQEAANEKNDSDIEADTDKWARKILGYDFEQKPVDPSDDELQRHQDELYDFKVFATKQAKEHHISFVHDFEWNNFCTELLSYFAEQKPSEWSEEDEAFLKVAIAVCNRYSHKDIADWLKSLPERFNLQPQAKQKDEYKHTGWVARDKEYNSDSGLGLVLFKEKPRRSCDSWSGAIASLQLAWEAFPDLKWEDEPMEVEIIIRKK